MRQRTNPAKQSSKARSMLIVLEFERPKAGWSKALPPRRSAHDRHRYSPQVRCNNLPPPSLGQAVIAAYLFVGEATATAGPVFVGSLP
jgi:hypothetical protein